MKKLIIILSNKKVVISNTACAVECVVRNQFGLDIKIVSFELQHFANGNSRKFKFGENAFNAFPNILVNSGKLNLNALLSFCHKVYDEWSSG